MLMGTLHLYKEDTERPKMYCKIEEPKIDLAFGLFIFDTIGVFKINSCRPVGILSLGAN